MNKESLREMIWDTLEDRGEARFPFPPHGRIPNFNGAQDAAERLAELDAWEHADVIKSNPDAPQLPVRRKALREGKTIYMAVPRLKNEKCFIRLDPADISDIDHATTVSGSSDVGVPVSPEEMDPIDLIVSGSVAVTERGQRVGKGEGYSDLEFAILREFLLVDDSTTTVTTVHDLQVVDQKIPTSGHDVPMDWVLTPTRLLNTRYQGGKPSEIVWELVDDERREEIPILSTIES